MLVNIAIGLALVSGSFAALLPASPVDSSPEALVTPGPSHYELFKKQNDIRYIGWKYDPSWVIESCNAGSMYFATTGTYDCCSTGVSCQSLPVGCAGTQLVYRVAASGSITTDRLTTYPCGLGYTGTTGPYAFSICNTRLMYENDRDTNPKLGLGCGKSTKIWSFYRALPASAVTASSSRISIPVSASATTTLSSTATTSTATTSSPSDPVVPDVVIQEKSKSKAWIAGAVVGPILGLALIGLLAFFFMRRKKNKSRDQHVAPASGSVPAPGATAYQQNTYPTNPGSPQPPQYHPNMQQNTAAVPFGVGKQDSYYPPGQQSPVTSQGPHSPYGAPQQWQQPGYNGPSPSMTPVPQNAQPSVAPYNATQRHFSSELEGSNTHGQPEMINVQPKK